MEAEWRTLLGGVGGLVLCQSPRQPSFAWLLLNKTRGTEGAVWLRFDGWNQGTTFGNACLCCNFYDGMSSIRSLFYPDGPETEEALPVPMRSALTMVRACVDGCVEPGEGLKRLYRTVLAARVGAIAATNGIKVLAAREGDKAEPYWPELGQLSPHVRCVEGRNWRDHCPPSAWEGILDVNSCHNLLG